MRKVSFDPIFVTIVCIFVASCRSTIDFPQETKSFVITTKGTEEASTQSETLTPELDLGEEGRIIEVELRISAPFSDARIWIHEDGRLKYEASSPETGIEKIVDSSFISKQQFDQLVLLIERNDFCSFERRYEDELLMDATTLTVSVKLLPGSLQALEDASIHEVSCYGICPEKIVEVINLIKGLWGKEILEVGV